MTMATMANAVELKQDWDKVFPKSDKVEHTKATFCNRFGITLAADVYKPKTGKGKFAAIAVSGPFGAVKEQSSGLYAQTLAERGFLTIAFDPSFTGESGGEPRYVASPDINTEEQKKLYVTGGTIVAIGGLESGSSLSQTCKKVSSYTKGSWYALYSSSALAFVFQIPTNSNMGTPLVVSTSGTASLKKGVTVSSGTSVFGGYGYTDATVSGGSTVTLSNYSSGSGGGGWW